MDSAYLGTTAVTPTGIVGITEGFVNQGTGA